MDESTNGVDYSFIGNGQSAVFGNQGRMEMMNRSLSEAGAVTQSPADQSGLIEPDNYNPTPMVDINLNQMGNPNI
jgi:hypothetical protein